MSGELEQEWCIRCGTPICDDDPVPYCEECYQEIVGDEDIENFREEAAEK